MRAIPPAGGEIVDTASGKSGPVGPAQPASAIKSSDASHLSDRAIEAVLLSRALPLVVAQRRHLGARLRRRHDNGDKRWPFGEAVARPVSHGVDPDIDRVTGLECNVLVRVEVV